MIARLPKSGSNDTLRKMALHVYFQRFPQLETSDLNAEQELQELIQRSCLIRNEGKGDGINKGIVNCLGRWM
jgi:hypothetical protein